MCAATSGKLQRASIDKLNPLAGTVGIELVSQTLALTAASLSSSASREERSADTFTASPLAQVQQLSQGKVSVDLSRVGGSAMGQSGEAAHSDVTDTSDRSSTGGQASSVVDSEHSTQQQQQHLGEHDSHSTYIGKETVCESDDEHAVLIAASEDHFHDVPEKKEVAYQRLSRKQRAAAERQRVWYKERAVQLTILG